MVEIAKERPCPGVDDETGMVFLAPSRSLRNGNVCVSHSRVCLWVTLFDSPTVFVKWLLGDQLFVDILYIFVNGTSRVIF